MLISPLACQNQTKPPHHGGPDPCSNPEAVGPDLMVNKVTLEVDYEDGYDDFAIVGDRLFVLEEASSAADQVSSGSSAGAQMTMIRRGGGQTTDDDREPEPFAIVCYELP